MSNNSISNSKLLPLAGGLITIDINGLVLDYNGNVIKSYVNYCRELVVLLSWIDGYREYKVEQLVALTFKPLRVPVKYWFNIQILHKDGNNLNVQPDNLSWLFPVNGIESCKYPGFYFIPSYTRYVINKEGILLNFLTGNILQGHVRPEGYVNFCLRADNGQVTTVGKHRLLALTFLEYDKNVDSLDVNHIDGVPSNNSISNLEWATRSNNMLHAYKCNLRNDNKTVIVTNHNTGKETEYYSAHECERKIGLKRSVVHYRIKHGKGKVYAPGYSFRYKDGNGYEPCSKEHYGIPVSIKNLKDGKVINLPSITKCSEFLNVSKKVIQKRLKDNATITYKNFEISKTLSLLGENLVE